MRSIETHASEDIVKVLVGNKCDMNNRVVSVSEGQKLANEYGIRFFETSAKTGVGVDEAFLDLARQALHKLVPSENDEEKKKKIEPIRPEPLQNINDNKNNNNACSCG